MKINSHNEHSSCILCGSTKLHELNRYSAAHLVRCKKCGFIFSGRIPSEEELAAHYNLYSRQDYLSPVTVKRYEELLDQFEPCRKTNRILDVGCGIGYFLEVAKKRGWSVYGTEYTEEAVKICRNKEIIISKGSLGNCSFPNDYFDVVTSFEVIEHINNPNEDLGIIHKITRPGGIVYLTTPNFNSIIRFIHKEKDNNICYPEHLSYYTPATIRLLFKRHLFRPLKIQTTGFSISRYKNSSGKSSQQQISQGSDDELLRVKMESSASLGILKKAVNTLLTLTGLGDSLKASFVKR